MQDRLCDITRDSCYAFSGCVRSSRQYNPGLKSEEFFRLNNPYLTHFGFQTSSSIEYKIHQSEWIKLLKILQWSNIEILEIPSVFYRNDPRIAKAIERFEDAQDNFRKGDWEETMLNCRKVIESMNHYFCGKLDMSKTSEMLRSYLGDNEKTRRFDSVINSLKDLLELGRHEIAPEVPIKRPDAEFALLVTGALLKRLGQG